MFLFFNEDGQPQHEGSSALTSNQIEQLLAIWKHLRDHPQPTGSLSTPPPMKDDPAEEDAKIFDKLCDDWSDVTGMRLPLPEEDDLDIVIEELEEIVDGDRNGMSFTELNISYALALDEHDCKVILDGEVAKWN